MPDPTGLVPFDLEVPVRPLLPAAAPLSRYWTDGPSTPPCRVCNQGRSGLPGDNHTDCRRQERTWLDHASRALDHPEVVAAVRAAEEADLAARAVYAAQLEAGGLPGWMVAEQLRQYWPSDDEWEE